ncbi:MAG: hypothetical protein AB7G23_20945 [Vicinamibacterales bacterium]
MLGVIGSMAGNIAWAAPHGGVLIGVGVFMSLVLPVSVALWKASAGATGWARAERGLVMAFICAGAALYSLVHITLLLQTKGLPGLIAWVPAAVMEALVVMAARASAAPQPAERAVETAREPKPADPLPARRDATPPAIETEDERRKRLQRDRAALARASRKRHDAGDHSTCNPKRCADARRLTAVAS